ncbi:MAG TPA: preprotein translocase subunit SecE [Bacillota bacterium]|nr:MAG: preprotein translocase subunit SecE [Firmicutes bacterium ADurb.Bin153]HNV34807.1 preprotein translocase subunit SecE [Bacillota bacterium]
MAENNPGLTQRIKNFFGRINKFFRDVRAEFKKVQWPNKKELTAYTLVVIGTVAIVAAFLGLIDYGLSAVIQAVVK